MTVKHSLELAGNFLLAAVAAIGLIASLLQLKDPVSEGSHSAVNLQELALLITTRRWGSICHADQTLD